MGMLHAFVLVVLWEGSVKLYAGRLFAGRLGLGRGQIDPEA